MARDPLKIDQLQIEPGSAGTRLIRKATDGSLEFLDPRVTGGITLLQLAGLKAVQNVLVVGKAGAGAGYTTIQSAIDAATACTQSNPFVVLVFPGVYQESVNIVWDGLTVIGYGARLEALETTPNGAGKAHTLQIQATGTIPKNVTILNLDISNIHDGYSAVRIGGGAASQVGQGRILLQDCQIRATGAGGNPIKATSVNHVRVCGGSMAGSSTSAVVVAEECASFLLDDVADVPAVQMDFDTTGVIPSEATGSSLYRVSGCTGLGLTSALGFPVYSELLGRGSLEISGCTGGAKGYFLGNRTVKVLGSILGDVTLDGTVAVTVVGGQKGAVASTGTESLMEPVQTGVVAFAADTSKAVVFVTPNANALYGVTIETDAPPVNDEAWYITGKSAAGFTINYTSAQTLGVTWTTHRVMGGATN